MIDLQKLQPVADRVIPQVFKKGFDSLSHEDRVFFVLWCFGSIVDNGGIISFFYNSPADFFPETVDALRLAGLAGFAEVLESAAQAMFAGDVPRTMDGRNAVIDDLPEGVATDEECEEWNRRYIDQGGGDRVFEVLEAWYFSRLV